MRVSHTHPRAPYPPTRSPSPLPPIAPPSPTRLHGTPTQVKLWDISGGTPSLVATQELGTGAVFTASFCAEAPHLLAAAGATGEVVVWDVRASAGVAARYPGLAQGRPPPQQQQQADAS